MTYQEIDSGVTVYEFNKTNMAQFPVLDTEEAQAGAKNTLLEYLRGNDASFYMMLSHERKDFTLFHFTHLYDIEDMKTMANDVFECMENRELGVIDISKDESGFALEVWVKELETNEAFMYVLFPYDMGVIKY